MKHVKFLPWVGNNYNSEGTSKRVMVLGESHYCAQPSDAIPEITRNAIWKAKNRTETYKAYTSFEKTFLGKVIILTAKTRAFTKCMKAQKKSYIPANIVEDNSKQLWNLPVLTVIVIPMERIRENM